MPRRRRLPLPSTVHEFLADEQRAANTVIGGAAAIGAVAFFAGVLAILLMH